MYSDEFKKLLKPIVMIQYLIWMGYFLSLGIYVFIAYKTGTASNIPPFTGQKLYLFTGVFGAIALGMLPAAFIIKRFMLPMKKLKEILSSKELPPGAGSFLSKEQKELFEKLNDEEKRLYIISGKTFKPFMMVLGCYNSIAVFGMAFSIISGRWQFIFPFILLGAAATLTACPDPEKLFDKLRKADE